MRECFLNFFLALIACGHQRTAKQCHERWVNHLRPDIRRGCWTEEEDAKLIDVYAQQGNRFTKIAEDLGRSGIDVRNRIYSTQRMVTRYLEGKLTNNIRRHGILFVSCYNIFTPLSHDRQCSPRCFGNKFVYVTIKLKIWGALEKTNVYFFF